MDNKNAIDKVNATITSYMAAIGILVIGLRELIKDANMIIEHNNQYLRKGE